MSQTTDDLEIYKLGASVVGLLARVAGSHKYNLAGDLVNGITSNDIEATFNLWGAVTNLKSEHKLIQPLPVLTKEQIKVIKELNEALSSYNPDLEKTTN